MSIVDFEQAAADRLHAERHRKNAISSQLLLRRMRKHHYGQAPDALKWVPSVIVGDPLIKHIADMIEELPSVANQPFPDSIELQEYRTVKAGSIKVILAIVSRYYRVSVDDITSTRRTGKIALARNVAMYFANEHTTQSIAAIGRALCRDHTTVIHGCRRIARLQQKDQSFALQIMVMRKQIIATGQMPDAETIEKSRKTHRSIANKWDFDAEVRLIKEVKSGKKWEDVGRSFGISMSAAFNKYMRMEIAHRAFVAAEA
jgi:hypothetical protein